MCAGSNITTAATDQQDTCPMDVTALTVPAEPAPMFSPQTSSGERREVYQRPKTSATEPMTMDVKDEEKKDPLEPKTPTASAQDGGAQDGTSKRTMLRKRLGKMDGTGWVQ